MDSTLILADLREQFGAKKTVLYADELADALGKTVDAIYSLTARDGLPVPILIVGGRPAASIYAVADWLAGNSVKAKKSKPTLSSASTIPEPKRKRASLGKYLLALQVQQGFLAELHSAIQSNLGCVGDAPLTGFDDDENDTTFDDYVEPFFVDSDGLVISHARDEEKATITPTEFIPDWMKDGVQLWRTVQTREEQDRKDAQIFREIEASLPIELGLHEWTTIIRKFIREQLTSKGVICSFSIHQKPGNPHVHMMTTRCDERDSHRPTYRH